MKDKPLRTAALPLQLRHSTGQDFSSVHPTVTEKTAAATLALKLTRGDTKQAPKRHHGWLNAALEKLAVCVCVSDVCLMCVCVCVQSRRGSYQNHERVGVDRGQPPVSSPASQLHGSRHIFDSYSEPMTSQPSHRCAQKVKHLDNENNAVTTYLFNCQTL